MNSDSGDRYPGSSRAVGDLGEPPTARDWGRPTQYRVGGVLTDFYTIGQLAVALNRSPVTIRKWERLGIIPVAAFRAPAEVKAKARRLYSRAQLEIMVGIAWDEGLMRFTRGEDGRDHAFAHVTETHFSERVQAAFQKLAGAA